MMDEVTAARRAAAAGDRRQGRRDPAPPCEQGLDDLLASARRAADETQAIDQAFQERVRRNYEMLSEAVQLMGVVAQGGQGASVLQRSSPADRARRPRRRRADRRAKPTAAPGAARGPVAAAGPEAGAPEAGAEPSLRGRLRLTPTATDDEFKAVFDAAGGQAAPDDAGWTWKELLTTLDGDGEAKDGAANAGPSAGGPVVDLGRLGEALFNEIEAMAIDPGALLSRAASRRSPRRSRPATPPAPARWSAPSPPPPSAASPGACCRIRRSAPAP